LAIGLACFACSNSGAADRGRQQPTGPLLTSDCDPLVPTACGYPFPSDVYRRTAEDGGARSVRFGAATLPKTQGMTPVAPELFHDFDGFSPGQAPMTHLPGATTTGLPTPDSIEQSLGEDSPTILLEADTLARVPHFVDIDRSANVPDGERAFMLRPVVRLKNSTRYIVAIRRVVDAAGVPLEPSPTFRALRDGSSDPEPSVESRRRLYRDIFSKLERADVPKADLQLAWDYTTASRDNITGHLVQMRDDALAAVGNDGPEFVFKSVAENPHPKILRRIVVTMTVPLYLTSGDNWDAMTNPEPRLVLDDSGRPVRSGTMQQDVLIHVPNSVSSGQKHGLAQNGHGLLGSKEEGSGGYLPPLADDFRWVIFATDFFGFRQADILLAASVLSTRPDLLRAFVDRQHQGHINQLLAMRMMIGRIARDGIRDGAGTLLLDPSWIDPAVRVYRGDSQGGIMGSVYMAISTDVTRGLLAEGGLPYNLLLNRSSDWPAFGSVLAGSYANALDRQLMLGLIQMAWDRTEPSGYAPYITRDPLPGTPVHQVLLHAALGDHQVTTLGTHILARSVGAKNLRSNDPAQPLLREVWGVESVAAPLSGSALVEYDFALAKEPLENVPPTDGCDPHGRVRRLTPTYQQQDAFFRSGTAEWFCDGACNCDGPREELGCELTRCEPE
jgi:hypothetical protein